MRRRACGAVIYEDQILMVRHVHHGRDYWTLPGGGINWLESPAKAAEREVLEETGLSVGAQRHLFTSQNNRGTETYCYLMTPPNDPSMISLGIDPEQQHLPPGKRMLQDVQWFGIESMGTDPHVQQVLDALNSGSET